MLQALHARQKQASRRSHAAQVCTGSAFYFQGRCHFAEGQVLLSRAHVPRNRPAKAELLALDWKVRLQRRRCLLDSYSGGSNSQT